MIHRVFSSLPSFKELEFHSGLNVLIAQKEAGATDKQTRNRAGKTSLIEIIHFLTGANAGKDSLFRSKELGNETFGAILDLGREKVTVKRSGKKRSKLNVAGASFLTDKTRLSVTEWTALLGEKLFGLHDLPDTEGRVPTFRSLFAYFVRRQGSGAFTTPEKQATMQQTGDLQVALLYLLGLDWQIASEWQKVRDREKNLAQLKKAAKDGAFGSIIGKAADLRTRLTVAEQLEGTKNELDIERNRLTLRLRRDFAEQKSRLSEAILAFEETSRRLYESAGSMTIEETSNGPHFQFPMQGARSKGIKNMQIFCFDMMLMRLRSDRGTGPGFVVHDSHLFDGVDGRQVASALKVGAETAEELGFQYIVTMNEDDALKETTEGFDVHDHVLPVVLTDAKEDGGIFGFRF